MRKAILLYPRRGPTRTRRSAPYSYISSRSRRAGFPTLTTTTLDTGYTSTGTTTTTRRRLTKSPCAECHRAGILILVQVQSCARRGGSFTRMDWSTETKTSTSIPAKKTRPPLARGRKVVPRDSVHTKQRVVYQQAYPQYIYAYEGEEECEDGELYCSPAPPQDPYSLVRHPAQPKSTSFRVPNTNTDVTITVKKSAPPPVRYTLPCPRQPAERIVYVSGPVRGARTVAPRIYEVGDDGYTIAGDDEFGSTVETIQTAHRCRALRSLRRQTLL